MSGNVAAVLDETLINCCVTIQLATAMARFYGQNIEIIYINVRKYIHPYYVAYIDVMCNKRCLVQRGCKSCPMKLKDVQ